jgi:hypothetical protein
MAETRNPGLVKEVTCMRASTRPWAICIRKRFQIKVVIDRVNQQKYIM